MQLMDCLGTLGGLNRLLWTLGALANSFLFKERIFVEIMETLYKIKDNGEDVDNFKVRDILVRKLCCFKKSKKQI
jgi:hypothetical protein